MQATYDVWVAGDSFSKDTYQKLEEMLTQSVAYNNNPRNQNASQQEEKASLYLAEYYNVFEYHQAKSDHLGPAIARVLNSVIQGLNTNKRLPRFLLVILDKDVIEDLNVFDFGAVRGMSRIICWLTKQIDIAVRCKRLQILDKKPGAIYHDDSKVIYVETLRRVDHYAAGSLMEGVCTLRTKFNKILNKAAAKVNHYILVVRNCSNNPSNFQRNGLLSAKGKAIFWEEIDELLERFDAKQVGLHPKINENKGPNRFQHKPGNSNSNLHNHNNNCSRRPWTDADPEPLNHTSSNRRFFLPRLSDN